MIKIKQLIKSIIRSITSVFYAGKRFCCPICGGDFRKLKAFKGIFYVKGNLVNHYTENAICPKCGSDTRHRFLVSFINKNDLLKSGIKLLHFAPEQCIYDLISKNTSIEYHCCDINPSAYYRAVKIDITDIQYPKNSFDAVICCHVLEHIKDDTKALKELYRILKPGGWVLVSIPIYGEKTFEDVSLDSKGREKMYGIESHLRMNGLDFRKKITAAGFDVNIYSVGDIPGCYFDTSVSSPHIESDKYLFYCRKI